MNKIILIATIVLFSLTTVSGQKNQAWLYDFDFLVDSIIKQAYPLQSIVENLLGEECYNAKILSYKMELSNTTDTAQFISILRRVLNLTLDLHSSFANYKDVSSIINMLPYDEQLGLLSLVDSSKVKEGEKYFQYTSRSRQLQYNLRLPIKYIQGEYILFLDLKYGKMLIPQGSKLKTINGIDVDNFVKNNIDAFVDVNYDVKRSKFYTEYLIPIKNIITIEKMCFSDGFNNLLCVDFKENMQFSFFREPLLSINLADVKYFKKDRILYIRLFNMLSSENHIRKIKKYTKKKNIDRVIIDIRNNWGGSDVIWREIFEELIPHTTKVRSTIVTRDADISRKAFQLHADNDRVNFRSIDYLRINSCIGDYLIPSSTNPCKKTNIVVLFNRDIFSSALACAKFASRSNFFTTVGMSIGKPLGMGQTPSYIMLPKTGIIIRIPLTLDITKAINIDDLFLQPDYIVNPSILDYENWHKQFGSKWKRSFLFNKDPFYKKVLQIEIN